MKDDDKLIDNNKCPAPEHLLAWLDGETADEVTAQHISGCPACREFVSAMREEKELLWAMLDAVPAPDLTGRVMAGIEAAGCSTSTGKQGADDHDAASLLNAAYCLVTAGVGLLLMLAYNYLPGLIDFELRPVAVVRVFTALDRLVVFVDETLKYIGSLIFPGAPLIPPLILVLAVLLVNLIGKRRLSDV